MTSLLKIFIDTSVDARYPREASFLQPIERDISSKF